MKDLITQLQDHSQEEALINLCNQFLEPPLLGFQPLKVGGFSFDKEESNQ